MKKITISYLTKENNIDLLARFIHELKTPITSIKEAISLLSDISPKNLNPKSKYILTIAQEEVDRLVRMIENFLEFASIKTGKIQLVKKPVKINNVINQVIESQGLMVQKKKMQIKKILTPKPAIIFADKDRIFEVITNLIDNALKFTPTNGTITVQTQILKPNSSEIISRDLNPKSHYVKVTISNNGPDIPKKDLERIFQKFERLKPPTKIRGIGLGLTIARDIIELHQGKIWATNEKSKGANFHFVLPIEK